MAYSLNREISTSAFPIRRNLSSLCRNFVKHVLMSLNNFYSTYEQDAFKVPLERLTVEISHSGAAVPAH